jgi:hypothetical protein
MLTRALVDLLRIVAWLISWLVVWSNQLADALEYRQQVLERIEATPDPWANAVPNRIERW